MGYLKADANRIMSSALAIGSTVGLKHNRRIVMSDEEEDDNEAPLASRDPIYNSRNTNYEQMNMPIKKKKIIPKNSHEGNQYIINIHH